MAVVLGGGAYRLGRSHVPDVVASGAPSTATPSTAAAPAGPAQKPGDIDPATGRKVLYWHDPMVPGQRFDKPGKSPFMNMMLEPVYRRCGRRHVDGHDQSARAAEPRRALGEVDAGAARGAARRRWAPSRSTSATRPWCRRAPTASSRNCSCARRSIRCARASRSPNCTCPTGWPRRRSTSRCAQMKGAGMDALADAARQRMRLAGMSDAQVERVVASGNVAAAHDDRRADRRRGHRADGARRDDRRDGRAALPHQRPRHGVDQRRVAGSGGGARASGDAGGSAHGVAAGHDVYKGTRQCDPAGSQRADAHDQGAHRGRQPRAATWCRVCMRPSTSCLPAPRR